MEVIDHPRHGSIIYHPSLLPKHRGASAINCTLFTYSFLVFICIAGTLMQGDTKTGLTVFWPDDGLDTGPILLQKEVAVEPDDTVNGLYKRFLFPKVHLILFQPIS